MDFTYQEWLKSNLHRILEEYPYHVNPSDPSNLNFKLFKWCYAEFGKGDWLYIDVPKDSDKLASVLDLEKSRSWYIFKNKEDAIRFKLIWY
jgi:hypothetical protein